MIKLPIVDNSLFIDATAFEYYTTCRRSFKFYFIDKRQSAGRKPALEAGAILHTLMEFRRLYEHGTAIAEVQRGQEELCHLIYAGWVKFLAQTRPSEALIKFIDRHGAVTTEALTTMYPGYTPSMDDFRTESFMIDVIRGYNDQYLVEPFNPLLDKDGKPVVEVPFAFPLVTFEMRELHPEPLTVYWTGRLDYPTVWPDKSLWNSDYKTSTMDTGFQQYSNDQAQLGYLWALYRYTGQMPQGFMIDGIFWRAPSKSGKGTEFKRHRERIEPERIEEWHENTIAIIEDILRDALRGYFPMETKWCFGKFGACQYLDICKLPPQSRNLVLHSPYYQDVTWNPLRK